MKILEEGSIPEDKMAGMQHVGKKFRCPTCYTVVQIEAQDIEAGRSKFALYDFERNIPCPKCEEMITFTMDELIHENVDPPSWEEVRSTLHKELRSKTVSKGNMGSPEYLYQQAVQSGDEEEQERILRAIWEKNQS